MSDTTLIGQNYPVYRSKDGTITESPMQIPALGPEDVVIRITHSGVCNADAMYASKGAPIALGHEGVGIVTAVGSQVTQLVPGDRVGGGFHRHSCGKCHYCLSGRDIYCHDRVIFGSADTDNGTFSPYYVGKESYVHKIPDSLTSEHAAPLQCAGATVYTALKATVQPTHRVGVIGVGGLGHLAIQFAAKLGAEVVALSTTCDKKQDAMDLGAHEFTLLQNCDVRQPLDVIIVTSSSHPDWQRLMTDGVLARGGVIVPLTASSNPLTLPAMPMLALGYHVHSSLVASRAEHDEMLIFAARHGIKPIVQVYKHNGAETIQRVFKELLSNEVRYRAVLEF